MPKIAVLVSGGGTNLQAILDAISTEELKNTEVKTVISNRSHAFALVRAKENNIDAKCIRPMDFPSKEAYTNALIQYIESFDVDLIVLAGFLVILEPSFIRHFKNRIINIHPSLIPAFAGDGYYGLKVHEEALRRGVKLTGATVHIVDEITDHGPILYQKAVEVHHGDTPEILQKRVMEEAEWTLLPKAIEEYPIWSVRYQRHE
jgi:phosphoribosylglycinamide formyltransferase-1